MRIDRSRSRTIFRRRRRNTGCLPFTLLLLIMIFTGWLGRDRLQDWLYTRLSPPAEQATLTDVSAAFNRGDLDRVIQYAQGRYNANPDSDDDLAWLVRALIYRSYSDLEHERDRQQALSLTQAATTRTPFNNTVNGLHAFALQANGDSEAANRAALRVIGRDSENIAARLALALSYGGRGIFQAALREADRAIEITRTSAPSWQADAHRVRAIALSDLGRYTDASDAAAQAVRYQPRLLALYFESALYASQVGDLDSATAHYFNVLAFDEDNIKARLRLCEVSSTLRERDAAADWCLQVTQRAPGFATGWYRLGREYYLKGDWQGAQDALARCSSLEVAQGLPIAERRFECWYLQGQAAEVLANCDHLLPLYAEYQQMAASANLGTTWVYPPEGPTVCVTPQAVPAG